MGWGRKSTNGDFFLRKTAPQVSYSDSLLLFSCFPPYFIVLLQHQRDFYRRFIHANPSAVLIEIARFACNTDVNLLLSFYPLRALHHDI